MSSAWPDPWTPLARQQQKETSPEGPPMDELIRGYAELERRIVVLEFDVETLRTQTARVVSERQACMAELARLRAIADRAQQ